MAAPTRSRLVLTWIVLALIALAPLVLGWFGLIGPDGTALPAGPV